MPLYGSTHMVVFYLSTMYGVLFIFSSLFCVNFVLFFDVFVAC